MKLNTASMVISFSKKLEKDSAGFYEVLAQWFPESGNVFLFFARENGKNITHIERAYYGVISDAIEGCFAFDIDPDAYAFDTELPAEASYSEAVQKSLEIERKIIQFYLDAAQQSQSLMADVTAAFRLVAKKRSTRKAKLASLLGNCGNGNNSQ